jgi:hypothetical protein
VPGGPYKITDFFLLFLKFDMKLFSSSKGLSWPLISERHSGWYFFVHGIMGIKKGWDFIKILVVENIF